MDRMPVEKPSDNSIHRHFMIWTQKNIFREAYSIAYRNVKLPNKRAREVLVHKEMPSGEVKQTVPAKATHAGRGYPGAP